MPCLKHIPIILVVFFLVIQNGIADGMSGDTGKKNKKFNLTKDLIQ